jgi:hypothetical protein
MLEIRETPVFTRQVLAAHSDEEYRRLQLRLIQHPDMGVLIPGTGGLRKLRWKAEGRGTRGGFRVIYYWAPAPRVILMLYMFPKNEQGDLSPEQKRLLAAAAEQEFRPRALA